MNLYVIVALLTVIIGLLAVIAWLLGRIETLRYDLAAETRRADEYGRAYGDQIAQSKRMAKVAVDSSLYELSRVARREPEMFEKKALHVSRESKS